MESLLAKYYGFMDKADVWVEQMENSYPGFLMGTFLGVFVLGALMLAMKAWIDELTRR